MKYRQILTLILHKLLARVRLVIHWRLPYRLVRATYSLPISCHFPPQPLSILDAAMHPTKKLSLQHQAFPKSLLSPNYWSQYIWFECPFDLKLSSQTLHCWPSLCLLSMFWQLFCILFLCWSESFLACNPISQQGAPDTTQKIRTRPQPYYNIPIFIFCHSMINLIIHHYNNENDNNWFWLNSQCQGK